MVHQFETLRITPPVSRPCHVVLISVVLELLFLTIIVLECGSNNVVPTMWFQNSSALGESAPLPINLFSHWSCALRSKDTGAVESVNP